MKHRSALLFAVTAGMVVLLACRERPATAPAVPSNLTVSAAPDGDRGMTRAGFEDLGSADADGVSGSSAHESITAHALARPFAVVTNQGHDQATVIDLSVEPPTVVATVPVGRQPLDVGITPDGSRALVTNVTDATVSVIDLTTSPPALLTDLPVQNNPIGIEMGPKGAIALVSNSRAGSLSIIDLTVDPPVVGGTVPVGGGVPSPGPYDAGITADGEKAIVGLGGFESSTATAVDLTQTPPVEVVSARVGVSRFPIAVGTNPQRTVAVIPGIGDDDATVVDLTTFPFTSQGIIGVGDNPGSQPDITAGGLAVVANASDGSVSIIDVAGATPSVVTTLPVGVDPRGVGIIDGQNIALIANRASGTISRLDLSDFSFLPPIEGIPSANRLAVHELAAAPESPEEMIDNLISDLVDLVADDVLRSGAGGSLMAKLTAALAQLSRGNTTSAVNQLGAFINQVQALIRSGRLTAGQGQALIDVAQATIDELAG